MLLALTPLAQTQPPATGNFLVLGLVVFFGLLVLFLLTVWVRFRNLRRDEAALEQISREE